MSAITPLDPSGNSRDCRKRGTGKSPKKRIVAIYTIVQAETSP
jgi:hypothetical protein